jgi:hypothetical protein
MDDNQRRDQASPQVRFGDSEGGVEINEGREKDKERD